MKREIVYKRENAFAKKVKELDERWFDYEEFLFLKSQHYGIAVWWKRQIYIMQKDAALAMRYAYSNQHPYQGHKVIRRDGQLIFSSQVCMKAFYLRFFILLIQGCGDKLAQMVRSALGITKWDETTITIKRLKRHLKLTLEEKGSLSEKELVENIYERIKDYLEDETVETVLNMANALKHRWLLFYQGEGLQPAMPKIEEVKDDSGKVVGKKLPFGAYTYGEKIEKHIKLCLRVNNMFVDMANAILDQLNFERFYEYKNGKRALRR
jgi:hypothetical protein